MSAFVFTVVPIEKDTTPDNQIPLLLKQNNPIKDVFVDESGKTYYLEIRYKRMAFTLKQKGDIIYFVVGRKNLDQIPSAGAEAKAAAAATLPATPPAAAATPPKPTSPIEIQEIAAAAAGATVRAAEGAAQYAQYPPSPIDFPTPASERSVSDIDNSGFSMYTDGSYSFDDSHRVHGRFEDASGNLELVLSQEFSDLESDNGSPSSPGSPGLRGLSRLPGSPSEGGGSGGNYRLRF